MRTRPALRFWPVLVLVAAWSCNKSNSPSNPNNPPAATTATFTPAACVNAGGTPCTSTPTSTLTPSPTSTFTTSPTSTPSPSSTFTFTSTRTSTSTSTPTATPSPTDTAVLTSTATFTTSPTSTPSPTSTLTSTSTSTPTSTPTTTSTSTPSATPSPTVTAVLTPTATFTATDSPTFIPTPTLVTTWALPVTSGAQQIAYASTSGGTIFVPSIHFNVIYRYNAGVSVVWGSSGTADGQFTTPYGVATDLSGNLYVADSGNNRIQMFNSSGAWQWSSPSSGVTAGSANGLFNFPTGLAVDASGDVWVADSGNNRLVKLDPTGAYVSSISGTFGGLAITSPWAVATDNIHNWVYVSNLFCCIYRFQTDGTFLNQLGTYGSSGNGHFQSPDALAVDPTGNRLYVVDPNQSRVQVLSPMGDFGETFGNYSIFGSGSPLGVAVDGSGNVYVASNGTGSIQVYGP